MNKIILDDISTRPSRRGLSLCLMLVLSFCSLALEGAKSVYIGEKVQFKNETDGPEGKMKWEWDFGDNTGKNTEFEPSHIYKKSGNYNATLSVTVPNVKIESKSLMIEVKSITAICAVASKTPYIGQTVEFTHKTDGPKGLKWKWNFGDSRDPIETDKQVPVSYVYLKSGKKQASLTVDVPNVGEQKLGELSIEVKEVVAKLAAQSAKVQKVGEKVPFTNNTDGPEGLMDWEWDFGDGTGKSTEKEPTHVYKKPGEYTVTLTVRLKDSDGNIIDEIDPIIETLNIAVKPSYIQPFVRAITAGTPKSDNGAFVLPVTVEVNGTYKVVQLRVDNQKKVLFEGNQTFNEDNKDKYIFTVPIKGLKGDPSLFPRPADRTLAANATVIPDANASFGYRKKFKEESLSFKVTPDRSGLFWILLGIILVLIGALLFYMWWWSKQPRVEGQLQNMDGSGRIDLYDFKKKRDLEIDLGDVITHLAGEKMKFKFRGRRSDPQREITILTSNFEVNSRQYSGGEYCDVSTRVIFRINSHTIEYKP